MKGITKGSGFHTAPFLRIFRQCVHTTNLYLPTGNLDSASSRDVMDLLTSASRKYGQTVLMITHNMNLAASARRVLRVTDGRLTDLGGTHNEKLS